MGKIYVTDPDAPASAMAVVGCFALLTGFCNGGIMGTLILLFRHFPV